MVLLAACVLASSASAQTPVETGRFLLAAEVLDLRVDVDTTVDIMGETRFFSSRHNWYAGGRLIGHNAAKGGRTFYTGSFMGVAWGKSSFLLNWEEPGLQSFEPLEASFTTLAIPIGFDANLDLGGLLTLSPYASANLMWLRMKVEIDDEDFSGSALKLGLGAGLKVALQLGGIRVAAGAGWLHILNDEIDFEIDDSLTFKSRTSGNSPEYFLGVEL